MTGPPPARMARACPQAPAQEPGMALIQWTSKLSLNVDEIDRQHRKLVDMINELDAAMGQGMGKAAVGKILDGLVAYTQFHFGAEEKLLAEHKYPGFERHKHEHETFVKKLIDFKAGYAKGQLGLSISVMSFLSTWLTDHIMGTDRQYAPHLLASGVK
jgi:hemerythrin-like metal-binding protein